MPVQILSVRRIPLISSILPLLPATALAATGLPPLVADRPDFTEAVETVDAGHTQLESGYTHTADRAGGVESVNQDFPELLIRHGLTPSLELRISLPGYTLSSTSGLSQQDANDAAIGFKVRLLDDESTPYRLSLLGAVSGPTGSGGGTSGAYDPEFKLAWATDLSDSLGLSANLIAAWPTENGERFFQSGASLSLGASLTDSTGAFLEAFGYSEESRGAGQATYVDTGVTHLITPDLMVDARVGFGVTEAAADRFAGLGVVYRF